MSESVTFWVPGVPRAMQTGSVVRVRGRAFPLRRNTGWAAVVGLAARQHAPPQLLAGPLVADLLFVFARPRTAEMRKHPTVRPDAENLAKGILDAFNGVLYKDDGQIVDLLIHKRYGPFPGVEVKIRLLPDDYYWPAEYCP